MESISASCDKEARSRNEEEVSKWDTLKADIANMESELRDLEDLQKDKEKRAVESQAAKAAASAAGASSDSGEAKEIADVSKRYSVGKALNSLYRGEKLTGIEAEMHQEAEVELEKFQRSAVGVAIPHKMIQLRTDISQTASDIAPTEIGAYVQALRENAKWNELGVDVLDGLTADHLIPVVGKQNVAWAATENAPAADGGTNYSKITLTPNRMTSYVNVSNRLILQNGNIALNSVMADLGLATANVLDQSMWSDTGVTNAPTNIYGQANAFGFTSTAYDAGVSAFKDMTLAEQELADREGLNSRCRYLLATNFMSEVKTSAQVQSVTPGANIDPMNQIANGYRTVYSVAVDKVTTPASAAGDAMFGDFSKVKLGFFGGMDMVLDRSGDALLNDQTRIVLHRHVDYKLAQANAIGTWTADLD